MCSWSLRPTGPADLIHKVQACGFSAVQIALDPIRRGDWPEQQFTRKIQDAGINLLSGMMAMRGEDYSTLQSIRTTGGVRLDAHWPENLAAAHANSALARRLGLRLVTFHAGFLPHDRDDPLLAIMIDRLRQISDAFTAHGIAVAFETGQETAETLCGILTHLNHPLVGVNFDPANMILYGMGDPVEAFSKLSPWVRQVHIKDAIPTTTPGTWGTEKPVGSGAVNWHAFLPTVHRLSPDANLVIERESNAPDPIADIRTAATLLRSSIVNRK